MTDVENEALYRFSVFAIIFIVMALLEILIPKRDLGHNKSKRWFTNISIIAIDSLMLRLLGLLSVPLLAMAFAILAEVNGWGLFNYISWPIWLELTLSLLVLDFAIYLQHVISHKIPFFWAFHQMHHADVDIDVTTAARFHPIEIFFSMLYKIVWVLVLGPSALAVFLFEVILNGCALFNHSNIALPARLDKYLRLFIVTPDMHRVHHSVIHKETDSNYGFNLSIWDRLFGTYIPQPEKGHQEMGIGLNSYQSERPTQLLWSLSLPFMTKPGKRSKDQ